MWHPNETHPSHLTTHDRGAAHSRIGLTGMDMDCSSWLTALGDAGTNRDAVLARLHKMLLKVAIHEAYQRGPAIRIGGPELDDLAHQAATDAMASLLRKLDTFRGESLFTTWAYRVGVGRAGLVCSRCRDDADRGVHRPEHATSSLGTR
jgi:hypothetical protein